MQCISPIRIKDPSRSEGFFYVGCYKCGACRANRRADWSFRIAEEAWVSTSSWFVTLTYSDQKLPFSVDQETGEILSTPTLQKRDFQLFMKRLRKPLSYQIRYYAVGEYGTKTKRPHYHMILFNINAKHLHHITNAWDLGHVRLDPVNPARIHYVTKYHVNYARAKQTEYEPEFAVMSRRPGIGFEYTNKMQDWHYKNDASYIINNG